MKPEEQKAQRCVLWLQSVEERARSWQNANPAAIAAAIIALDLAADYAKDDRYARSAVGVLEAAAAVGNDDFFQRQARYAVVSWQQHRGKPQP